MSILFMELGSVSHQLLAAFTNGKLPVNTGLEWHRHHQNQICSVITLSAHPVESVVRLLHFLCYFLHRPHLQAHLYTGELLKKSNTNVQVACLSMDLSAGVDTDVYSDHSVSVQLRTVLLTTSNPSKFSCIMASHVVG